MLLGSFGIEPIRAGLFRVDGGAMFGVVPRVLWQELVPPDTRNRIRMALNCLLVRTPEHIVLVETGIGDKFDPKWQDVCGIEGPVRLSDHLGRLGIGPTQVDYVVCTHLHFDHAGGCAERAQEGGIVPSFPRARYVVRREEWEDSLSPDPRSRASYAKENLDPLAQAGRLEVLDSDCEVAPGISLERTGGHTRGHQMVKITPGGQTLCFVDDILPTQHHVRAAYVSSYDTSPLDTMKIKERILMGAACDAWLLALSHSVESVFWKVVRRDGEFALEPADQGAGI